MKLFINPKLVCCFTLSFILISSCKKEKVSSPPVDNLKNEIVIKNLKADYSSKPYFKFSTGEVVTNPKDDNWDICFEHAQLKINGGNMGNPIRYGQAKGIIVHSPYQSIKEVPNLSGLLQDNGKTDFALGYRSGGKSWYYTDENMNYLPYPEKTIFMETADQKAFIKLQILSFYRDMPNIKGENYETLASVAAYYTFRYQYIQKGERFH